MDRDQKRMRAGGLWPWIVALVLCVLFQCFVSEQLDPYFYTIIMYAGVNIILATSLNLITGITGQFSLGHAGFMSIGGYLSAFLTVSLEALHPEWFQSSLIRSGIFLGALGLGGLGAGFAGFLVGLPSLRLKGDYLAIVTLGFGEIFRVMILNIEAVGGARGLPNIPPLSHFGWVYSFVVLTLFTLWRLIRSPYGRAFLAVREDEIAAEATGVHSTRTKVLAMVLSAFFAGIAGGLFAHYLRYLNPQTFDFNRSFEIVIMVVLGGMGSLSGSVLAALFLTGIREALRPLQEFTQVDFRMVIYSLLLILLMLTRPNGILGKHELAFYFSGWLGRGKEKK
jgi:branched-chain amino acid transport system permease protein